MKSIAYLILVLGAALAMASGSAWAKSVGVVVRTDAGWVSGARVPDGNVISFKGIPYARPPVGALRWRAPQPVAPWRGIRSMNKFGDGCMQATPHELLPWTPAFMTQLPVSEDCLYLNVWTPKVGSAAMLPVIVYIYGGGFVGGAGSVQIYDGQNLAKSGVVLVTINYRLGVFGFLADKALAAESPHHSAGNYGLLDQIAALRWVHRNIDRFGGNPRNVTIWGQSAGAMSAEALVLSPVAKGLFQRAQADSGVGLMTGIEPNLADAERNGRAFAHAIGATSLRTMRAIPATKLLRDAEQYAKAQGHGVGFVPDVDGWVIPASLRTLAERGSGSDVPMIIGWNENDWMLFQPPVKSVAKYRALAREFYGKLYDKFMAVYPAPNLTQAKRMQVLSSQDRNLVQSWLWVRHRRESGDVKADTYLYLFTRAIPWPQHAEFGAFHSSELPYFFGNLALMHRPWQSGDRGLSTMMMKYLVRFATVGNPNTKGAPRWRAVVASSTAMHLDVETASMPICSSEARCSFWEKYFNSPAYRHAPVF